MSCFLAINNKSSRLSTNNNKDVQKTVAKQLPSYYGGIKAPNISDPLILGFSIVDFCNCKRKCTTKNKKSLMITANVVTKKQNDSDPLILVVSTESVCSYKSKCPNTKNNDNK